MRRGQNMRLKRFASVPSLVLARSVVCVVPVARPGPVELKVKVGGGWWRRSAAVSPLVSE